MTIKSTSSLLKPLGEHFEMRAQMSIFEAAVPSVESPALAVGLSKESSLFLELRRATNRPAGGEGRVWVGLALSFPQCQLAAGTTRVH